VLMLGLEGKVVVYNRQKLAMSRYVDYPMQLHSVVHCAT
jgi:hypothetical protein